MMNRSRNRQSMRRVVFKQGYLKKLPNSAKFGSSMKLQAAVFIFTCEDLSEAESIRDYSNFQKPERRWFVFGVIGTSDPYIEYYEDESAIFDGSPINIIFLESVIRIVRDQSTQRYQNVFTIVLKERLLSLVAPSRSIMFDWCRTLETQFKNLGLLETNVDGENDYVDVPGVTHRATARRNQASDTSTSLVTENNVDDNNNGNSDNDRSPLYVNATSKTNSHLIRRNRHRGLVTQTAAGTENRIPDDHGREDANEDGDEYENLWDRNGEENNYLVPSQFRRPQKSVNSVNRTSPESHSRRRREADNEQLLPEETGLAGTLVSSRQSVQREVTHMDHTSRIAEGRPGFSYQRMSSQDSPHLLPSLPSYQPDLPASCASSASPSRTTGAVSEATPQSPTGTSPLLSPFHLSSPPLLTMASSSQSTPQSPTSPYPGVFLVSPSFPTSQASAACSAEVSQFSVLPEKMRESLGAADNVDAVEGWTAAPPLGGDAPPPYMPRGVLERGANKSLKISQMEKLQQQQNNAGGLKVVLKRIDCHHCLALVQCFGAIWIAGWNQTTRPFLQTAFHVGDQLVSVNGQVVESAKVAYKLIKQCSEYDKISLIIKRLPKARIFSFKRSRPGEDLGIVRERETGKIVTVRESGLASLQGLPAKSQTMGGDGLCHWYITEVNHRPLSLFFKDKEIEHRLNAVGLDISILVQPEELVMEFKKQLKQMKKYKDFLVK